MTGRDTGTLRITHRLLEIGDQTYPLAQISRVQTLWLEGSRKIATAREVILFVLVLIAVLVGGPVIGLRDMTTPAVLVVLVGAAVLVYRAATRFRRCLLVVETSGGQCGVLASKRRDALDPIKKVITDAIENPPATERLVHVGGDVVIGDKVGRDQINQRGHHNTLNVRTVEAAGSDEVAAAAAELRAFISRLSAQGLVAPDGSVTDPGGVVHAVEAEKTEHGGLRTLTAAIAGGAKDAVLDLVKGGVAALVTALLGQPPH